MLFNSYAFILLFLPIVLLGFFQLARVSHAAAATWLTLASLFFYGYWNPAYVGLLLASILANYFFGTRIAAAEGRRRKWLLIFAVAANLLLLAYYKYANFFLSSIGAMTDTHVFMAAVVLPLGISFFTFTQIAFLVDTYQGAVKERNFVHYALFVTYFPHLIAGPVLHHKEMMPQFQQASTYHFNFENAAVGLTIFAIGLFKKVALADSIAPYANNVFDAAHAGAQISFIEAWTGALAYTLQLYFDFSGYSDMAVGLSRLFGVVLPINFDSPYKSLNIIEFWRRWHMTLSRFLRDYLYIALGGNRKGGTRRYANLVITMVLGGLWHGAGWTFVLWGALHGIYLLINHAWRKVRADLFGARSSSVAGRTMAWLVTFVAVVVAWVMFRAADVRTAQSLLAAMSGLNGIVLPEALSQRIGADTVRQLSVIGVDFGSLGLFGGVKELALILGLLGIALLMPNTYQIMKNYRPALLFSAQARSGVLVWCPNWSWVVFTACISMGALLLMRPASDFLYFQF